MTMVKKEPTNMVLIHALFRVYCTFVASGWPSLELTVALPLYH